MTLSSHQYADLHVLARGIWRDCCALPSGIDLAATLRSNPLRTIVRVVVCDECGSREQVRR